MGAVAICQDAESRRAAEVRGNGCYALKMDAVYDDDDDL
jgi:hypothetical protein